MVQPDEAQKNITSELFVNATFVTTTVTLLSYSLCTNIFRISESCVRMRMGIYIQ